MSYEEPSPNSLKTATVQTLVKLFDFILAPFSPYTRGQIIYMFHSLMVFPIFPLLLIFGSKYVQLGCILFFILSIGLFITFKGCIITGVERHYMGKNETITDPFIRALGIQVNSTSRYWFSWIGMAGFLSAFLYRYNTLSKS